MRESIENVKLLIGSLLEHENDQFAGGFGDGSDIERLERGKEFIEWLETKIAVVPKRKPILILHKTTFDILEGDRIDIRTLSDRDTFG